MPITCSQRTMTDEERSRLRDFRESPGTAHWALGVIVGTLILGGCCAGAIMGSLQQFITQGHLPAQIGASAGSLLFVVACARLLTAQYRTRRKRRDARCAAADTGLVEVTEITFERMWSLSELGDKRKYSLLEARPFILTLIPAPGDEDEHEAAVRSVRGAYEPVPIVNGTFPRRRVVIEHVRVPRPGDQLDMSIPEPPTILLSMSWLDERMTPEGELQYEHIQRGGYYEGHFPIDGLRSLAYGVPKLVRGPWMVPPKGDAVPNSGSPA